MERIGGMAVGDALSVLILAIDNLKANPIHSFV